ncbi:MAG TPA: hypothetical protein VLN59_07495 [Burkholderiales bacterium]|nr:hypothetical protein [Burkholderiales bacterium]
MARCAECGDEIDGRDLRHAAPCALVRRYTEQTTQRIALCDLLIGRAMRMQAADVFEEAELSDSIAAAATGYALLHATQRTLSDSRLDRAAHMEWIALRTELGQIHWGGRFNRCGYHAHQIDAHTAAMTWIEMLTRGASR